jgi:hypothetical protein
LSCTFLGKAEKRPKQQEGSRMERHSRLARTQRAARAYTQRPVLFLCQSFIEKQGTKTITQPCLCKSDHTAWESTGACPVYLMPLPARTEATPT